MCLRPLEVTASGNSAIPFFRESVTFFTSINAFNLFFAIKKSNLVLSPNLVSGFISIFLSNFFIRLFCSASSTILLVMCVLTPTFVFLT